MGDITINHFGKKNNDFITTVNNYRKQISVYEHN